MKTDSMHAFPVRAIVAGVLLVAVGVASAAGEHEHEHGHGDDNGGGHSKPFGKPAPAQQADRTIRVTARDTMRFEPRRIRVDAGETIRFVVMNTGELRHSFTLGTPRGQEAHEREMQGMAVDRMATHMQGNPAGMVIPPGERDSLTWRFEGEGPVEFACHIPGHFGAGMIGRIRIE